MNIQRQTSVISNFLYIEVFTQVPWTSIYPSFTVYILLLTDICLVFVRSYAAQRSWKFFTVYLISDNTSSRSITASTATSSNS